MTVRLREEADDYPFVVTMLPPKHRVIECRDGIQWIVQQRIGTTDGHAPRWRSLEYFRHSAPLRDFVRGLTVEPAPALAILPGIIDRRRAGSAAGTNSAPWVVPTTGSKANTLLPRPGGR